ncbi:hypothetical protein BH10BAC3_BH10BAC3_39610 [soil metagenome]
MKNLLRSLATTVAFSFIAIVNFAQAPTLGTAANFVLFTSTGAVGNTGISQVTGNVGTNGGAITGFGNVNGVMHTTDGATLLCAADLLIAYNQLKNAIPTAAHAPLLGNGETLNAGTYSISGNTTLSNTLTLDGQNNPNAVFIFQISAPFSTNASSQIKLINGALACNVFWKVEGAVSMASNTNMRGTVVANNAAIGMSSGVTLEGRALSTTGAVSVTGVLAYIPTGCGSVVLSGPVAPNLLTSACYAIFSGNGEVTNAGITNVTGDVGTNVGLTSGYNALLVNGTIHPIPDFSTAAAAADLLVVYNHLNLLPVDIELLYPAQFGSSLVLTPHTYLLNAATTLTDTVFLNAEGNANAVFVIKINGALSTSTYAAVALRNGAQAKNVFWKVEGAVNINDYTDFKGTIVANNGAVSLNTGAKVEGRAMTTNGALGTAAITANITAGCNPLLPVSWLYFQAKPMQKIALIEWGTTNELNNGFFTIDKSTDGIKFKKLADVNSQGGAAKTTFHYAYTDLQPAAQTYYRITQTDINGQKNQYKTIKVNMNGASGFSAVNYVQGSFIYIQAIGANTGNGTLELYNLDGRKLNTQKILLTKEISTYKIAAPLQKGMYLVNMQSQGEKIYQAKVVVL